MKYCVHCSAPVENDDYKFCPKCGKPQNAQTTPFTPEGGPAVTPLQTPAPMYTPAGPSACLYANEACTPARTLLVKSFASKLFAAVCILQTLRIVCLIVSNISDVFLAEPMDTSMIIGLIIAMPILLLFFVPDIVSCVALWQCRAAARKASSSGRFVYRSIGLYRTCCKIKLVCLCVLSGIGGIVLLFLLIPFAISLMNTPESLLILGVSLVLFVILVGAIALTILVQVKWVKTVSAILDTAITGEPTKYISGLVIVMQFIDGVGSMIYVPFLIILAGALSFSTNSFLLGALTFLGSFIPAFAIMFIGGASIVTGIALSKYKSKTLLLAYAPPAPPAQPVQSEEIPAQSTETPVRSEEAPAQSEEAPAQSEEAPAQSEEAPAQSEEPDARQ